MPYPKAERSPASHPEVIPLEGHNQQAKKRCTHCGAECDCESHECRRCGNVFRNSHRCC